MALTSGRPCLLLTGERQAGKTTLCARIVQALQTEGQQINGLLTQHTGPHDLEVTELSGGARYALTLPFESQAGFCLPEFCFSPEALTRSQRALHTGFPSHVFLVDELGPLEFWRGVGWMDVFPLLREAEYAVAVLVIRPELLATAMARLGGFMYTVACVTPDNRDVLFETVWAWLQAQIG